MSGEIGNLIGSSWERSQQLLQEEIWGLKLQLELAAYKQVCDASGSKFDPFRDNMYAKPKIPFGPYFITLAEINYGTNPSGAFRLYQTLSTIPEGYKYHGQVESERVFEYTDLGAKVVGGSEAYDTDGKPMDGYVSIAVPAGIHIELS